MNGNKHPDTSAPPRAVAWVKQGFLEIPLEIKWSERRKISRNSSGNIVSSGVVSSGNRAISTKERSPSPLLTKYSGGIPPEVSLSLFIYTASQFLRYRHSFTTIPYTRRIRRGCLSMPPSSASPS